MARQKMPVPSLTLIETDIRCWDLRKAGLQYQQIADALGISRSRAYSGVQRTLERISVRLAEDNRLTFSLELERLDAMLVNLWPLTMPHDVVTTDRDGHESKIRVPVSFEAVDRVVKLMDRRAKMLGFDNMQITLNAGRGMNVPTNAVGGSTGEITPKDEAIEFLRVLVKANVIDASMLVQTGLIDQETASKISSGSDVVDAEVVDEDDEGEMRALDAGPADPFEEGFMPGMPDDDE